MALHRNPPNPYDVLGVPRTADASAIKSAFRALAIRWHPDKNPGDPLAEHRFRLVAYAWDILKTEVSRFDYDRAGVAPSSPPARPEGIEAHPAEVAAEAAAPRSPFDDVMRGQYTYAQRAAREARQRQEDASRQRRQEQDRRDSQRREEEQRAANAQRQSNLEFNRHVLSVIGVRYLTLHDILHRLHDDTRHSADPQKVILPRGLVVVLTCSVAASDKGAIQMATLSRKGGGPTLEEAKIIARTLFGFNANGNLDCRIENVTISEPSNYPTRIRLHVLPKPTK